MQASLLSADAEAQPPGLIRWFVIAMVGIGAGINYTMRVDLSAAMTKMPQHYHWSGQ